MSLNWAIWLVVLLHLDFPLSQYFEVSLKSQGSMNYWNRLEGFLLDVLSYIFQKTLYSKPGKGSFTSFMSPSLSPEMTKIQNKSFNNCSLDTWNSSFLLRPTEEKWKTISLTKETMGHWDTWRSYKKMAGFFCFFLLYLLCFFWL